MSLYAIKNCDFEHRDTRGYLIQLVHDGYTQINVLHTVKGETRGKHYHKTATEAFYVIEGTVVVTLSKEDRTELVIFSKGAFFELPPYVVHSMYFPEDCTMIAMYDFPIERPNGAKDIFAEGE